MPKQISPFDSQHHESYVVELLLHLLLAIHDRKCIHISVMLSISAKLSTNTIAHGKPCITHILFVTMPSLVKSDYSSIKGRLLWRNLNIYTTSLSKSNFVDSLQKSFMHYQFFIYICICICICIYIYADICVCIPVEARDKPLIWLLMHHLPFQSLTGTWSLLIRP